LCGHGFLDLASYDTFLRGGLVDEEVTAERFAVAMETLPTW
jgi:predicted alternative tryptophan synthase beta-subunit